jgi:DNA-binding MarR family transcriptional regulator
MNDESGSEKPSRERKRGEAGPLTSEGLAAIVGGVHSLLQAISRVAPFDAGEVQVKDWAVLSKLSAAGLAVKKLGNSFGLDKNERERLLLRLEERGWVRYERKIVQLTDAGRAALADLNGKLAPLLEHASHINVRKLVRGLRKVEQATEPSGSTSPEDDDS